MHNPKILWVSLLVLPLLGLSSGAAIWQFLRASHRAQDYAQSQSQLEQVTQQVNFLKQEHQATTADRSKLQQSLTSTQQKMAAGQKQLTALQGQVKTLTAQLQALQTENTALKAKLAAAQQQAKPAKPAQSATPKPTGKPDPELAEPATLRTDL